MPRAARSVVVDLPLHVVQRGINRQPCFFERSDFEAYLRYLHEFSARFACSVHAYCLMTDHVHLLLTPHAPEACARLMKQLGQCHVQRINHRLRRTGTLWEGRFHSCVIDSDSYVLACYRYIELNPVRAGMVDAAGGYEWSSYLANVALASSGMLKPNPAFLALGVNAASRSEAYKALFDSPLHDPQVEEIRKATRVGCAVGTRRRKRGRPKNGVCPHLSGSDRN